MKDHGRVPVLWGQIIHHPVVDFNGAAGDILESGDHSQGGGFATAGRTDENNKFLVFNFQIDAVDDFEFAVFFTTSFKMTLAITFSTSVQSV